MNLQHEIALAVDLFATLVRGLENFVSLRSAKNNINQLNNKYSPEKEGPALTCYDGNSFAIDVTPWNLGAALMRAFTEVEYEPDYH